MDSMDSTKIQISNWDGTISNTQFRIAATAFAERWNKFNSALPQCEWIPSPNPSWLRSNPQVDGYLVVENVILPEECCKEGDDDEGKEQFGVCYDNVECVESDMLVQNPSYDRHFYDLHIVYSTSYRVPVLYFRGHCSDGQPLSLNDIEKDIPAYKAEVLKDSKWTFITQEYHPYLNRPWYTLHPCGTSEFMKLLCINQHASNQSSVEITAYLVSWFSVVAQVFGLKIPIQMVASSG